MTWLLSPPLAFIIYLGLVGLLSLLGRWSAATSSTTDHKTSAYASGEASADGNKLTGYQPFFRIALFFAILHLGVIVAASGTPNLMTGVYIGGLMVILVILLKGR